jgi:hypothetical protein
MLIAVVAVVVGLFLCFRASSRRSHRRKSGSLAP